MNWKATASSSEKAPRRRGYIPPSTEEEKILVRHIADLCRAAQFGRGARVTGFLSDREQELARAGLSGFEGYARFWGGYEGAERCALALDGEAEPGNEAFGIVCLQVTPGANAGSLTHRDYLGALMALGIKREGIGDILVDAGGSARVYARGAAAQLILEELASVGRAPVHVAPAAADAAFTAAQQPEERSATVPSLRLDAVLAAMMHTGRSAAAQLVRGGAVSVNHVQTDRAHYEVFEGDTISVRGRGKFRVCQAGAHSKKGRIIISYRQY